MPSGYVLVRTPGPRPWCACRVVDGIGSPVGPLREVRTDAQADAVFDQLRRTLGE